MAVCSWSCSRPTARASTRPALYVFHSPSSTPTPTISFRPFTTSRPTSAAMGKAQSLLGGRKEPAQKSLKLLQQSEMQRRGMPNDVGLLQGGIFVPQLSDATAVYSNTGRRREKANARSLADALSKGRYLHYADAQEPPPTAPPTRGAPEARMV